MIMQDNRFLIIGLVIALIGGGVAFMFYNQSQSEIEYTQALKQDTENIHAENLVILKKIKELKDQKKKLKDGLKDYGDKIKEFQQDIASMHAQRQELLMELAKKEKVVSGLSKQLDTITTQETALSAELDEAKSGYHSMATSIGDLRKEKIALEKRLKVLLTPPKGVELKKIVVKSGPKLAGELIEVNTEYNFAVVDLGLKDDLRSGDLLGIYRDNNMIAKAVAENIYQDMSSVIVLEEYSDVQMFSGDGVKLLRM
ncbi:hypothetical protein ACFL0T_05605 [Candidatus Omnitrophota bacterium]